MGSATLKTVLTGLGKDGNSDLLIGWETADDAAAIRVDEEKALLQTVDFFPPMVDDPFTFGTIAAANAVSDIYAMGGTPFAALNIAAMPECLSTDTMTDILRGGSAVLAECGVTLAGGHTVVANDVLYGLAVSGWVHPDKIISNASARPNDLLVLTKPLGTGLTINALQGKLVTEQDCEALVWMAKTNRDAAKAMVRCAGDACTDITGFGLAGHAMEMAEASQVRLRFFFDSLPLLPQVWEWAAMGLVPAGTYGNRQSFAGVDVGDLREPEIDIVFDPQTSGGLLIAVQEEQLQELVQTIRKNQAMAAIIGRVESGPPTVVFERSA